MKRGDLVRIVASDGDAIGTGIYLGERWYDVFETFASYVYFTEGAEWKFSYFDEGFWNLEGPDWVRYDLVRMSKGPLGNTLRASREMLGAFGNLRDSSLVFWVTLLADQARVVASISAGNGTKDGVEMKVEIRQKQGEHYCFWLIFCDQIVRKSRKMCKGLLKSAKTDK